MQDAARQRERRLHAVAGEYREAVEALSGIRDHEVSVAGQELARLERSRILKVSYEDAAGAADALQAHRVGSRTGERRLTIVAHGPREIDVAAGHDRQI